MDSCSSAQDLSVAVAVLRQGGVVLHATEGVWGLACDPFSQTAVERLLQIKSRPVSKGLIVIGGAREQFTPELVELSEQDQAEIDASWPGPVTWVLPNVRFPAWVCGSHSTVAIRVPGHAQARLLCMAFGAPLVSTSANKAGDAAATTQAAAVQALGAQVDCVVDGATAGLSGPSTIRELGGATLR